MRRHTCRPRRRPDERTPSCTWRLRARSERGRAGRTGWPYLGLLDIPPHGEADEHKDSGLCQARKHFEDHGHGDARMLGQVGRRVPRHCNAAKEGGHNAGELERLGDEKGEVRQGPEDACLDDGRVVGVAQAAHFEQEGGPSGDSKAHAYGPRGDLTEGQEGRGQIPGRVEFGFKEAHDGPEENDGHGVIQHALAEEQVVEARMDLENFEEGERRHGVDGRDERGECARFHGAQGNDSAQ